LKRLVNPVFGEQCSPGVEVCMEQPGCWVTVANICAVPGALPRAVVTSWLLEGLPSPSYGREEMLLWCVTSVTCITTTK